MIGYTPHNAHELLGIACSTVFRIVNGGCSSCQFVLPWTGVWGDVDLLLSKNRSLNLGGSNGYFCYCDANSLRFAAKTLAKKISATILHMSRVFAARPLRP